jgi:hypothetical protein
MNASGWFSDTNDRRSPDILLVRLETTADLGKERSDGEPDKKVMKKHHEQKGTACGGGQTGSLISAALSSWDQDR